MTPHDTVITLPSGTEIDIASALGDLGRATEALRDYGAEDMVSDLQHVAELLRELANPESLECYKCGATLTRKDERWQHSPDDYERCLRVKMSHPVSTEGSQ